MQHLNANRKSLHNEVIYVETTRDDVGIELAMQYNDQYNENVFSFVNNINTHEGGTHLTGFKSALTRVINNYASKGNFLKKADFSLSGDEALHQRLLRDRLAVHGRQHRSSRRRCRHGSGNLPHGRQGEK